MVKDAEAHADEDKKMLELVNARNQADALVHSVKKSLDRATATRSSADEKAKIEAAVEGPRGSDQGRRQGAHRGEDRGAREGRAEARREGCTPMRRPRGAGRARRSPGRRARPVARARRPTEEGNVVDAEFTEVKDKKSAYSSAPGRSLERHPSPLNYLAEVRMPARRARRLNPAVRASLGAAGRSAWRRNATTTKCSASIATPPRRTSRRPTASSR